MSKKRIFSRKQIAILTNEKTEVVLAPTCFFILHIPPRTPVDPTNENPMKLTISIAVFTFAIIANISSARPVPPAAKEMHYKCSGESSVAFEMEGGSKPGFIFGHSEVKEFDIITDSWFYFNDKLGWARNNQAGSVSCMCFESGDQPEPEPVDAWKLLEDDVDCGDGLLCDVWIMEDPTSDEKMQMALDKATDEYAKLVWFHMWTAEGETHLDYSLFDNNAGPEENYVRDPDCPDQPTLAGREEVVESGSVLQQVLPIARRFL